MNVKATFMSEGRMSTEDSPTQNNKSIDMKIGDIRDVSGTVNAAARDIYNVAPGATLNIVTEGKAPVAAKGLTALSELVQSSPEVRVAVVEFRTDFRAVYEQVDLMGYYKALHDQLHKLQFHCYNSIVDIAAGFPLDENAIYHMSYHALTLEGIVEQLDEFASKPSMPKDELVWIQEIGMARADLQKAVDELDGAPIKMVLWRLNRILANQPRRIHTLLNHSARALRLPELLGALQSVLSKLTSLDLDTKKVAIFQTGVDAFVELNGILSSLVEAHGLWQQLDVELRRINDSLNYGLNELELSWPYVKLQASSLYVANPEKWAVDLQKDSDKLDAAMSANNPAKIRLGFQSYERRVSERFYRVDANLKALCDDLRQIGSPLSTLLEMIS
jgi:hypothetical protein